MNNILLILNLKMVNFSNRKLFLDATLISAKRLNFSSATNVSQVQKFIEANIVHRQGYTYGAPEKKKFIVFIDDINLPQKDKYGVQRCNEVI
jgi:hypothetical protein